MLKAHSIFDELIANIAYEGKRHPPAALSSIEHQKEFIKDLVSDY